MKLQSPPPSLPTQAAGGAWPIAEWRQPRLVLDGPGEAFVDGGPRGASNYAELQNASICIRQPAPSKVIVGRLFVSKADGPGMVAIGFECAPQPGGPAAKARFFKVRSGFFQGLARQNIPGRDWFSFQADEAGQSDNRVAPAGTPPAPRPPFDPLEGTYDLFTGNQAIVENIQLDRLLPPESSKSEDMVKTSDIPGITVAEMDWKSRTQDLEPPRDALASLIPADQHAVFFPSFKAFTEVSDEMDRRGTPVLQLLEVQSQDAGTRARYETQLCLSLTGLGRLLGPLAVRSVALTGSDPYWREGSDLAILFEGKEPEALMAFVQARQIQVSKELPGVSPVKGEIGGVPYQGVRTAGRSVCSYAARLGDTVVVTNSEVQLGRVVAAFSKKSPALYDSPDYVFFRNRYPLGHADETAFVMLSDATIRRWCSARWRIGESRRLRARAVLSRLQARQAQRDSERMKGPLPPDAKIRGLGAMDVQDGGVRSQVYGSTGFMTPVAELPLDVVTRGEANAYAAWRDTYQTNWRAYFDPIAIRLTVTDQATGADVTVMPLILGTTYADWIALSAGAAIAPGAGDPHPNLLHFTMALNHESREYRRAGRLLTDFLFGGVTDPLAWVGGWVSVCLEGDPFWKEALQAAKPVDFLWENVARLPVVAYADVSSPPRLAAFLAGFRGFVEKTAPGVTSWETRDHQGRPYVRVGASESARIEMKTKEDLALYYAATGSSLVATFREDFLKQAMDRMGAGKPAVADPGEDVKAGSNVHLRADRAVLSLLAALDERSYQGRMREIAWSNIPILNEWKRVFPSEDPSATQKKYWNVTPLCPGGGAYAWNEGWKTMESTVYGHPGAPKNGPPFDSLLGGFRLGDFGVAFESGGVRARALIRKQ